VGEEEEEDGIEKDVVEEMDGVIETEDERTEEEGVGVTEDETKEEEAEYLQLYSTCKHHYTQTSIWLHHSY
jgi:hypothetical protein